MGENDKLTTERVNIPCIYFVPKDDIVTSNDCVICLLVSLLLSSRLVTCLTN